jgi:hypothetical protein
MCRAGVTMTATLGLQTRVVTAITTPGDRGHSPFNGNPLKSMTKRAAF